ncbi:MAG: hypothetical protein GY769_19220 [bacterium]|nr:hypothetical protein [bacterium]
MKGKVTLALFTHPVCSGCSEAYNRVQAFARDREDVEVEFYSLAGSSGRELARRWKVDSVPTVIVGGDPDHRIEGVPKRETLTAAVVALTGRLRAAETPDGTSN